MLLNVRARLDQAVARLPDRGWIRPLMEDKNRVDNDHVDLQNNGNGIPPYNISPPVADNS